MYKYKNLCYAGTFDLLHIGHKKMIKNAFSVAEKVSLGITSDKMARKKFLGNFIQSFEVRRNTVEDYLKKKNYFKRTFFFTLSDIYGSSIKDNIFDSILVSEATNKNAEKINEIRKSKGLKELKIVVAAYVVGDDRKIVTSERIRYGEIDRNGKKYNLQMTSKKIEKLILPEKLREELRKPLGKVINGSIDQLSETAKKLLQFINKSKRPLIVGVGDIIVQSLIKVGFEPEIKIIDFRSRRKEIMINDKFKMPNITQNSNYQIAKNEPGTINFNAVKISQKAMKIFIKTGKKQLIIIRGEEDLLALPAILFAPLHSLVLYGQWNLGVVMVEVTEEKKKEVEEILKRFKLAV